MKYSSTNLSGTSSVAQGVGHFLLFPALHGGAFVAFCTLSKLIPTYIPEFGGRGVGVYFDWCMVHYQDGDHSFEYLYSKLSFIRDYAFQILVIAVESVHSIQFIIFKLKFTDKGMPATSDITKE